jgi:type I restriction enzyme S subunit
LAITDIQEQIAPDFLYYVLCSGTSQAYFQSLAAGSGVKNLNADTIKQLSLACPSRAEQRKILDCLSHIDDLTAAQVCKTSALQQHKKGLMQGLFPAMDAHTV